MQIVDHQARLPNYLILSNMRDKSWLQNSSLVCGADVL